MWPLTDITIYYDGLKIPSLPEDADFSRKKNYICDFYHRMLNGYKPPKTGRICIHIDKELKWDEPNYFGAICSIANVIDEDRYLSLQQLEKYQYILNIVHSSCLTLARTYDWNTSVFENAYEHVRQSNFKFVLDYPQKKSRDEKTIAYVQVEKTEETSSLYLAFIMADKTKKIKVVEKKNWFWYDSIYKLAERSKWLDSSTFGVYLKDNSKFVYYSLQDDVIIGKIEYGETDF
jgi:hypothetical protein